MTSTELWVPDAELVDRARRGDREAFGDLVDRYETTVFRTALAALGSRDDAEDVTQDTFVAAYRTLETYRGEAAFRVLPPSTVTQAARSSFPPGAVENRPGTTHVIAPMLTNINKDGG